MEGSITLTEQPHKVWTVRIQLPLTFLRQFSLSDDRRIGGRDLSSSWGTAVIENGVVPPYRSMSATFPSLPHAEEFVALLLEQVALARAAVQSRPMVRYTLDLDGNGHIIKHEDRQGEANNRPF